MSFYKLSKQPLPPCQDSFMKTFQEEIIIFFVSVAFFIRLQALCWQHFNGVIMIFFIEKLFLFVYSYSLYFWSYLVIISHVIWTDILVKYSVQINSDPRAVWRVTRRKRKEITSSKSQFQVTKKVRKQTGNCLSVMSVEKQNQKG